MKTLVGLFALAAGGCAFAATDGAVTPDNLASRLNSATGGAVIRLSPGDYGTITIPRKVFTPAIRIDARQAMFRGLVLNGASGVEVVGGTVVGPGGRSYGISLRDAARVRIEGMTIRGAHRGIVVSNSSDIALVGNMLIGLISDGIDIALSQRVLVERNTCRGFTPTPAIYDASGTRLKDGDHPDCIQAWSRPTAPPTSDLTIIGNVTEGEMQGIFLGNHVRAGVDDGGFDRIVIRDNRVQVGMPNGIVIGNGRDSIVVDNEVRSVTGSILSVARPIRVKANLRVSGSRNVVCGNHVFDVPEATGAQPCNLEERRQIAQHPIRKEK